MSIKVYGPIVHLLKGSYRNRRRKKFYYIIITYVRSIVVIFYITINEYVIYLNTDNTIRGRGAFKNAMSLM